MKTCKSCIYWVDPQDSYDEIIHPWDHDTESQKMDMPFEVKKCTSDNITLFERNPDSKGVSLCDGSNYRATMYTGQDYGCVNHRAKNERN